MAADKTTFGVTPPNATFLEELSQANSASQISICAVVIRAHSSFWTTRTSPDERYYDTLCARRLGSKLGCWPETRYKKRPYGSS
jgi:hypothetical protein